MAQEVSVVDLSGQPKGVPISYKIMDNQGIEKGTLMVLSGGVVGTAKKSSASGAFGAGGEPFLGIAATEKVSGDGSTTIGLYTKGTFDLVSGSKETITAGSAVIVSGANTIIEAAANSILSGAIVGVALEDIAAAATGQVAVGIY